MPLGQRGARLPAECDEERVAVVGEKRSRQVGAGDAVAVDAAFEAVLDPVGAGGRGAALLVLWAAPAAAADAVCVKVAAGSVQLDGLLDDWGGHEDIRTGPDPRDASFSLRCAYDDHTLYLAVSQSGETFETLAAVQEIKRKGGRG